jgi:imidazole glycerol phosphate synthase subunit HisF
MLHYGSHTVGEIKGYLSQHGIPVRASPPNAAAPRAR